MQFQLDFDQKTRRLVEGVIAERQRRSVSMRPALEAVAADFAAIETEAFATQGRAIGSSWRSLSPAYRAWRARTGRGTTVLKYANAQGGRLLRSLTVPGAPWSLRRVTDDDVTVGTSLGIAAVQQRGGVVTIQGRRVTIPRRRFVNIRSSDKLRWVGYAQQYLDHGGVQFRRTLVRF